jgi:hypothetical protein
LYTSLKREKKQIPYTAGNAHECVDKEEEDEDEEDEEEEEIEITAAVE